MMFPKAIAARKKVAFFVMPVLKRMMIKEELYAFDVL